MFGSDVNFKGKPVKGYRWMCFTFLMIIFLCIMIYCKGSEGIKTDLSPDVPPLPPTGGETKPEETKPDVDPVETKPDVDPAKKPEETTPNVDPAIKPEETTPDVDPAIKPKETTPDVEPATKPEEETTPEE